MTALLACEVLGEPVGKGRPRVALVGGHARAYTPAKTASWEQTAAQVAALQWRGAPHEGPVHLWVQAVASRPQRLLRKRDPEGRLLRPGKPDLDNVVKAVADALVKAGVLRDDVLVTTITARSLYAAKGEGPRVEIRLWVDELGSLA